MGTAQSTGLPSPGRYQIASWATRFMRSAAAVLIGFCAMGPGVLARPRALRPPAQRLKSPGRPVAEQRGTRRRSRAAPGEIGAAGLSSPGARALQDNLGPQTRFSRASLPTCFVRGCLSPPPLRKTLGKPQDLTPPPPFRPVTQVYSPSVPSLINSVIETPVTAAWITKWVTPAHLFCRLLLAEIIFFSP